MRKIKFAVISFVLVCVWSSCGNKASTSQYQEESEPTVISNQNETVAPNNNNQLSESDQYVKEVISIFTNAYFYINWDNITIEQIDDERNEVRAKLRALNGKYNYVEGEE
jgi:hypothetical protein